MQRAAHQADDSRPKILIVDDDEIIAVALYRHLIGRGFAADLAVDVDEAKGLLAGGRYALVVLDAYLTGQLHLRALQFIDDVRESQSDAHILVLTAYGSPALTEYIAPFQHITIVRKPQPIPYLAELIEGFVTRRSTS